MARTRRISRRAAMAGLGVMGAGAMLVVPQQGAAQTASAGARHPLAGSWLLSVTFTTGATVAVTAMAGADGSLLFVFPPVEAGPAGQIRLRGPAIGAWEAVDDHSARYTAVHVLSDVAGDYLGTMTLEGRAVIGDDGAVLEDDAEARLLTLRDASNAVTATVPGASVTALSGRRITASDAVFAAGAEATPAD